MRMHPAVTTFIALSMSACGFLGAGERPIVEAHRGATDNWPQNSRAAVKGSVARAYPSLEIDLVVTKDLVPVLSHDPWVHESLCERVDGKPIHDHVYIKRWRSLDGGKSALASTRCRERGGRGRAASRAGPSCRS